MRDPASLVSTDELAAMPLSVACTFMAGYDDSVKRAEDRLRPGWRLEERVG